MKQLWSVVLIVLLLYMPMPTTAAVGTSASSAILMEADSGRVLYEYNAQEPRMIASITKLMSALVALESGHGLDEVVTVSEEWTRAEGSSLYLQAGEQVTLEQLLYGMLLRSGNDAALAVAGYCGGTVENFVARMNEKAAELGMNNSSFVNPNGLNAEGHYSSAYDMALLARACLENETLANIVATKTITLGARTFTNHNKLLWRYEGCVGMKTGYTEKAGRTLVSAAKRNGLTLICVTLNDPDDWNDHAALFDHGFASYRSEQMVQEGEALLRIPTQDSWLPFCSVKVQKSLALCLATGEKVRQELQLDQTCLKAPLEAGTLVGQAVYYINDVEMARVPLVTGAEVRLDLAPKLGLLERLLQG